METNRKIAAFIERRTKGHTNYDEFRLHTDPSHPDYVHDAQIKAAIEIMCNWATDDSKEKNRHCMLVAKMQSGKTGVFMTLAYALAKEFQPTEHDPGHGNILGSYFNIQKFYVLTGMNDTGLEQQTVARLVSQAGLTEQEAQTAILKNSEMNATVRDGVPKRLENCLIIVDESHYGNKDERTVLNKFLSMHDIGFRNDKLEKNNTYFVSVSATPFDEFAADIAECKVQVPLRTTEQYKGISEFIEAGLVYQAPPKKERLSQVANVLAEQTARMTENGSGTQGVVIVRGDSSLLAEIEQVAKGRWHLKRFYDKFIDYESLGYMMEAWSAGQKPLPLLILIKGSFRAGITIPAKLKGHIYAVIDSSSSPTETAAQGLAGRLCGYYPQGQEPITHIYSNAQSLSEYAQWESDNFSRCSLPNNGRTRREYSTDPNAHNAEHTIVTRPVRHVLVSGGHAGGGLQLIDSIRLEPNADSILKLIKKHTTDPDALSVEYLDQRYLNPESEYAQSVIERWHGKIGNHEYCNSFRHNNPKRHLSSHDVGRRIAHLIRKEDEVWLMIGEIQYEFIVRDHKIKQHLVTA